VNNPAEAVAQWRGGNLKPLCVIDTERMPYKEEIAGGQSWNDIPTCKEAGDDMDYVMLRGIMMPGGATADQVKYYVDLLAQVREKQEWKDYMVKGAFNQTTMSGEEYKKWIAEAEETHKALMQAAGFLAKK